MFFVCSVRWCVIKCVTMTINPSLPLFQELNLADQSFLPQGNRHHQCQPCVHGATECQGPSGLAPSYTGYQVGLDMELCNWH